MFLIQRYGTKNTWGGVKTSLWGFLWIEAADSCRLAINTRIITSHFALPALVPEIRWINWSESPMLRLKSANSKNYRLSLF